jgi:hypothetical protein
MNPTRSGARHRPLHILLPRSQHTVTLTQNDAWGNVVLAPDTDGTAPRQDETGGAAAYAVSAW